MHKVLTKDGDTEVKMAVSDYFSAIILQLRFYNSATTNKQISMTVLSQQPFPPITMPF